MRCYTHLAPAGGTGGTVATALADPEQVRAALTWASGRLKEVGDRARLQQAQLSEAGATAAGEGQKGVAVIAGEVSAMLAKLAGDTAQASSDAAALAEQQQQAAAAGLAAPGTGATGQLSAAARMTAAMEAAQALAGTQPPPPEPLAWSPSLAVPLLTDPVLQAYWRYTRLRGIRQPGTVPAKRLVKLVSESEGLGVVLCCIVLRHGMRVHTVHLPSSVLALSYLLAPAGRGR
jgi:hypothetical protein